jgi:hypothetical protein
MGLQAVAWISAVKPPAGEVRGSDDSRTSLAWQGTKVVGVKVLLLKDEVISNQARHFHRLVAEARW